MQFQCPLVMHKNRADRKTEGMGHLKAAVYLHSREAHDLPTPRDSAITDIYTDNSL